MSRESKMHRKLTLLGAGASGFTLGLGLITFYISEATSYLSDDPRACINCHVMIPEYASWQHSSHFRPATCNDCHVPHTSPFSKWKSKSQSGLYHSWVFTLRKEPQVIQARPRSSSIIQENCLRCHGNIVSTAVTPLGASFQRMCTDCHRELPHGRVHSLATTPNAAVPPLSPIIPQWLTKLLEGNKRR